MGSFTAERGRCEHHGADTGPKTHLESVYSWAVFACDLSRYAGPIDARFLFSSFLLGTVYECVQIAESRVVAGVGRGNSPSY